MKNFSQAMNQIIGENSQANPPFIVGTFESHGTQTMFGCVIVEGEEIMLERGAYGVREGDLVLLEIAYAHKFKRAINVMNLNTLLESLNYHLFYNSYRDTVNGQRETDEIKSKVKFLISLTKKIPKFSHSAQRAYEFIQKEK